MTNPIRIVAFSGNVQRPSKSRSLAEAIATAIASKLPASVEQYDIVDVQPGLGTALSRADLSPEALRVVEAIEQSDVLVVSTPTYKGSYTGLFKHLIDFVDAKALVGRPVVVSATGGAPGHALLIEHQLRPLFGFFSAWTIPTGIFAEDRQFEANRPIDSVLIGRIELAARQVTAVFPRQYALAEADVTG